MVQRALGALVMACGITFSAQVCLGQETLTDRQIDEKCEKAHPDYIGDFFKRRSCVSNETEKREEIDRLKREKEREEAREEKARSCIADDLKRMEGILRALKDASDDSLSLSDTAKRLEPIAGGTSSVVPANDNIKQKVLVLSVRPKCDTKFHFLINVRFNESGTLIDHRVWARNPPKGYNTGTGSMSEFSVDWETTRSTQLRVKAQNEAEVREAEARRQLKEREAKVIESLKLLNLEARCDTPSYGPQTCGRVSFRFGVENRSAFPISTISFGWNFLLNPSAECPEQLVSKRTEPSTYQPSTSVLLGPGETRWFSMTSEPLPDFFKSLPKWCFKISEAKLATPPK